MQDNTRVNHPLERVRRVSNGGWYGRVAAGGAAAATAVAGAINAAAEPSLNRPLGSSEARARPRGRRVTSAARTVPLQLRKAREAQCIGARVVGMRPSSTTHYPLRPSQPSESRWPGRFISLRAQHRTEGVMWFDLGSS